MSYCEITTISGIEIKANIKRVELELQEYGGVKIGQRVNYPFKDRGVKAGKVYRFTRCLGMICAEIQYRLDRITFLKSFPADGLRSVNCQCLEMGLVAKRTGM
jgi:hypothetical protein